jgi:hypothetical protein
MLHSMCDSYCDQGKLGGVDGKVIKRAAVLALEVMMLLIREGHNKRFIRSEK